MKHKVTIPYHPQANGEAEVSNREINRILKKLFFLQEKIGRKNFKRHCGHTRPLSKPRMISHYFK